MNKIFSLTFFIIFFVVLLNPVFADVIQESLVYSINSLSEQFSYSIDKEIFKNSLGGILTQYDNIFSPEAINAIVSTVRKNGMFLQVSRIATEDMFIKMPASVICYLEDEGFIVVDKINKVDKIISYKNYKNDLKTLSLKEFFKRWNNICFSPLIENIMLERIKGDKFSTPLQNEFVAIYTHHLDVNFEQLQHILDILQEEARSKEWNLIYIDELGLIPHDTIQKTAETSNISEKEAFSKVKLQLQGEIARIKNGSTIYDNNPFYKKLYAYLARNKIDSVMENLGYELWKKIVSFDEEGVYQKAAYSFMHGDMLKYLKQIELYTQYFYNYNVRVRDEEFLAQIFNILESNPRTIVFTIRGLGHYGIGGRLNYRGCSVKEIIICEGKIYENFNRRTWIMTLWANGVKFTPQIEEIEMAKVFVQDCIFYMIKRQNRMSMLEARRLSYKTVNKVKKEDFLNLLSEIRVYSALGLFKEEDDLLVFAKVIYDWCLKNGFLNLDELSTSL